MESLYLDSIATLIDERVTIFNQTISITNRNMLTSDWSYPTTCRYKIPDVVSIFVDIRWSTELSASSHHDKTTASIYEFFTWTAIRIFHEMWAEYIDIKWDGVFALYSKNKIHTALAAAITFKTFADKKFKPLVDKKLNKAVNIWYHMWIDQKTVLVKQLWLRDSQWRDRRKNEVWAWKPINMSAKLASLSNDWELFVSNRFYDNLSTAEHIHKSCGCWSKKKADLWTSYDLSNEKKFDFNEAKVLKTSWCKNCWKDFCKEIIGLDEE